jgi:LPXTG-motif cell wall-anchored protein
MGSTIHRDIARRLRAAVFATAIVATLTLAPAAASFADDIDGGPGPSVVEGTDSDDLLNGDEDASESVLAVVDGADDVINGHGGGDDIAGDGDAAAFNTAVVNGGDDTIDGGDGDDSIFGDGSASAVDNAAVHGGDDTIHGGAGGDYIIGDGSAGGQESSLVEGGDDILYGDSGDDIIYGDGLASLIGGEVLGGDDELYGGTGKDYLDGDSGNDLLCGLGGGQVNLEDDTLYGDEGSDLACAVDDHAVVSAGEKTLIQLAANDERLDDEGTGDGILQYTLGAITGDILDAVLNALTGELAVTAGCDGGTVGYTVTRDDVDASELSTSAVVTIDARHDATCFPAEDADDEPSTTDTVDDAAVLPDTGAGNSLNAIGAGGLALVLGGAFVLVAATRRPRTGQRA